MSPEAERHLAKAGIAAAAIDMAYTSWFWLILGRPHRARMYAYLITQLSAETALIIHLVVKLRRRP